jgi:hypothetical protein
VAVCRNLSTKSEPEIGSTSRFGRNHPANAAMKIINVAFESRNEVHMGMLNRLTCRAAYVNPDIITLWSKPGFEVIADIPREAPYGEILVLR